MTNAMRGIDLWEEIALKLNDIILTTGDEIKANNHGIWNGYLHRYTNDDWDDMLTALEMIFKQYPEHFRGYDISNIRKARTALDPNTHKCLDTKPHKSKAWATIMTMREVYNRVYDIKLPNAKPKIPLPPIDNTNFNDLFE